MKLIDVVVVADDTPEREALALALRRSAFLVRTAESGADGVARVVDRAPDVVLCDLDLGSWPSTWVFAERIRGGVDTRHVGRILIGSASAPRVEGVRAFDAYLRKPLDYSSRTAQVIQLAETSRETRRLQKAR